MNFPETAFISSLYAFLNTPGVGGIILGVIVGGILLAVGLGLLWLLRSDGEWEQDVYAYPTPALHNRQEVEPRRRKRGRR